MTATAGTRRRFAGEEGREDGTVLLLSICYGCLALALVLVVMSVTSLHLERTRLLTLADGAALAGAEAFDLDDVRVTPEGPRVKLLPERVDAAVREYIASASGHGLEDLTVSRATSVDGVSATVSLTAYWRPPVVTLAIPEGVPIDVTTVARAMFD